MKYAYSKELVMPFHFGTINFEKKAVQKIMAVWALAESRKAAKFRTAPGVRKSVVPIRVSDGTDISCYLMEPEQDSRQLPAIIYYHGGGFIFPVQEMMIRMAQEYVCRIPCRVFIPEYRLAIRNPYPVPFQDCYDALRGITQKAKEFRIDRKKMVVYGDSAGGCLAAAVALKCRDEKTLPLAGQMLIYPVLDESMNHISMEKYKDAVWSKNANRHMWNLYLGKSGLTETYAVPYLEKNFAGLPSTYVEAAQIDTLRDEAVGFAKKLQAAGIKTEIVVIPGAYHGYDAQSDCQLVKGSIAHRVEVIKAFVQEK